MVLYNMIGTSIISFVLSLFVYRHVAALTRIDGSVDGERTFNFPGPSDSGNGGQYNGTAQPRQGNLTLGSVSTGIFNQANLPLQSNGFPTQGLFPIQATFPTQSGFAQQGSIFPTQSIVNTFPNNTCICVPSGRCNTQQLGNTDGSGLIDIRILNSGISTTTNSITTITPNIVTPTTCQSGILERCCQNGGYQCGIRYPPVQGSRIASAGQADYGEYPWQAVLLETGDLYIGSGVLIDANHILTVAHKAINYTNGRQLRVRLGEWDASGANEPITPQDFNVARIFIHPNYNGNNLKNDVALLRLSSPVVLGQTPTITTSCLPISNFLGQRCWVAGWGKNDFSNNGAFQAIQKEVDVPIRNSAECENSLRQTRLGSTFQLDTQSFICAGGEAGKDACTGDGGSPLMCDLGGRWFVVGLVSWGIGCGVTGVPGVYTNVASYTQWILQTIITP